MEILKGRPAAVCAAVCVMLAVAARYFGGAAAMAAAAAALVIGAAALLISGKRRSGYRLFSVLLGLGVCLCMCLRCGLYYSRAEKTAAELCGGGRRVEGYVTEEGRAYSYLSEYRVRLTAVDGRPVSADAVLSCAYAADMYEGCRFAVGGTVITPADGLEAGSFGSGADVLVSSETYDDLDITGGGSSPSVTAGRIGRRLSTELRRALGGKEGELAAKILLADGDPGPLVTRDCRRSGVSHLLAVSGMHLAVISGLLEKLLAALGAGKNLRIFAVSSAALFYLFILGFPLSAVRSAAMLALAYAGFLSGASPDGLSSLAAAVSGILFASPASCADISFVLTVCATLGMTTLGGLMSSRLRVLRSRRDLTLRLFRGRAGGRRAARLFGVLDAAVDRTAVAAACCAAVNVFTLLPVALSFGEISLASFPANVVLPPVAFGIMILSVLSLVCLRLPFLGGMFAYYARLLCTAFIRMTSRISSLRGVVLSLRYPFVPYILVPVTVCTAAMLILRLRRKWLIVFPAAAGASVFAACLFITASLVPGTTVVIRGGDGSPGGSETAAVFRGRSAAVIDMSSGSSTALREALGDARSGGATEIGALILTHYHSRHAPAVSYFTAANMVRSVWAPEPATAEDIACLLKLAEVCRSNGVPLTVYDPWRELTVLGDAVLRFSGPCGISRSSHPCVCFSLCRGCRSLLYCGCSAWESPEVRRMFLEGERYDIAVLGVHGPVPRTAPLSPVFGDELTVYRSPELPAYAVPYDPEALSVMKRGTAAVNAGALKLTLGDAASAANQRSVFSEKSIDKNGICAIMSP